MPPAFKEPTPAAVTGAGEWIPARPADDAGRAASGGRSSATRSSERARGAGHGLEPDDRAGRGAVPRRPGRRPRRARRPLPDAVGRALGERGRTAAANHFTPNVVAPTINTYQVAGDVTWEVDVWGRIRRNRRGERRERPGERRRPRGDPPARSTRSSRPTTSRCAASTRSGGSSTPRVEDYERALQLTTNRHDQGVVSGVDVAQAQTQLETTRAQATDLGIARAQLEHAIAILVGKPPAELSIAPVETVAAVPPAIPDGSPVGAPRAPPRHRGRRTPRGGGQRADRRRAGRVLPEPAPERLGRLVDGIALASVLGAQPVLVARRRARADDLRGRQADRREGAGASPTTTRRSRPTGRACSRPSRTSRTTWPRCASSPRKPSSRPRAAEAAERAAGPLAQPLRGRHHDLPRGRHRAGGRAQQRARGRPARDAAHDASVGLIKALGGGWSATELPDAGGGPVEDGRPGARGRRDGGRRPVEVSPRRRGPA